LEGDIERIGGGYCLSRDGGKTMIPANRVLAICADRVGAFRILSEKTEPRNVEARLKLAEWCHNNGLPKEAVSEARAAIELRPNNVIAQRFLRFYEHAAAEAKPLAAPAISPAAEPAPLPESIDCSPDALRHFCTRVQPVLMNACMHCHGATAKFRLERVFPDSTSTRAASFQNLAAALAQVDRAKPSASPLLQKALTAHGSAALPPLRDRGTPAFHQLETFANLVANSAAAIAPPLSSAGKSPPTGDGSFAGDRPEEKLSGPKDAFDPVEFNKKKHPEKHEK
jgi:hypothetical protein